MDTSDLNNAEVKASEHAENDVYKPNVFALDIGGSLAKLVYERTFRYKKSIPCHLKEASSNNNLPESDLYDYQEREDERRRVCLIKFETRRISDCLDFIRKTILTNHGVESDGDSIDTASIPHTIIKFTGGGAYKYKELITYKLGVELDKEDEMECLIHGCVFMLRNIPDELFYYDKYSTPAHVFVSDALVDTFPFLLVNIGSGVSILKVESPTCYSRVGGSSIGGGTFWGIATLFSGGKHNFDELLALADYGDHRRVDMLVRDIYGGDYAQLGLSGDVIASSFGLAARDPNRSHCLADMVKSLLITVSNNIGQLACLYAKQHHLTRILFGGFFIRGHALTMEVITYAVNFWSQGAFRALFLRHEGYLGAVGAYLKALDQWSTNESKTLWAESYVSTSKDALAFVEELRVRSRQNSSTSRFEPTANADVVSTKQAFDELKLSTTTLIEEDSGNGMSSGSSEIQLENMDNSQISVTKRMSMDANYFELDQVLGSSLELFPLLESPSNYVPDTWDLTQDGEARSYWLSCFESGVKRTKTKAEESQINTIPDAVKRANQYAKRYIQYLKELGQNPSSCGVLTVRSLLSAQEHFLREYGFGDPYCNQKKLENRVALYSLSARLSQLSQLGWVDRQFSLVKGLLAGNVFDWGAAEMVKFFSQTATNEFGVPDMEMALKNIQARPWIIDHYDSWIEAISLNRRPYRCVLIFCDNSGADILLGVLPFALEFVDRGIRVILAANSGPAINDVTFQELEILLRLIAHSEPKVARAIEDGLLLLAENGQNSPCLDLRLTASSLVQLVQREKVDLIVIEGMGRAIHTNLYARFRVDCLKVAVIKNAWLAHRLGGELYGVVFKFEPANQKSTLDHVKINAMV